MAATPNPKLTAELIVDAALAVATADGLDAVSMRRVGSELGYSGMSLYGHVAGKDELLDLMADRLLARVPALDPGRPWDDAVGEFFVGLHAVLVDHRELAQMFTRRPTRGPSTARHTREVLAALTRGGLAPAAAADAYIALSCYAIGAALYMGARSTDGEPDPAWINFGDGEPPLDRALAEQLAHRADSGQFRSGLEHLIRGYSAEITGV